MGREGRKTSRILLVRIAISHGLPVAVLAELGDDVIGSLVADPVYVSKTRCQIAKSIH